MFVHFTMGDLDFLNNFSECVPFYSYWIIISSFPITQIMLHIKLTSLSSMYTSGFQFCSTFLYQYLFVVSKVLCCLIFCLVLSRLMDFDILFCYKFCSLNVMKSVPWGKNHVTNSNVFRRRCGWNCIIDRVLPLRNLKKLCLSLGLLVFCGLVGFQYHKISLDSLIPKCCQQ